MDRSRETILVTGGAGYIGSHTCKALAAAGYVPVAYDNLTYGHDWAVKWGPLEQGDILDRSRLDDVILTYKPRAVIHFAAFAYVGESVTDPGKYYRNNVAGSLTLLEAMRDHGIGRMVFSSTCATYGTPDSVPISEEAAQRPINPYGVSKLTVERMLADFGTAHGLTSVALRYFNAAGADPETQIGEDHDPETHLIPLVLEAAAGRRPNITVFGSDYATPDGTCIRDYIHVTDLAEAHVKALQMAMAPKTFEGINLGNGRGYSVHEVIRCAVRVTERDIPVVHGERRGGDPARLVSDARKAARVLGWTPHYPDLDTIMATAWAWHQKQATVVAA